MTTIPTREQVIEEMTEIWLSNWKTLSPKERERVLRQFVQTAFGYLSPEKLREMYDKLWIGTH